MIRPFPGSVKLTNIGELATYSTPQGSVLQLHDREILVKDGKIARVGEKTGPAAAIIDCRRGLVTPGFVDSHTHPVFLKGREDEFGQRNRGMTYQEIAGRGGGIRASIDSVRKAEYDTLLTQVSKRLDRFLKLGTTTVEAKSGYGLDTESECKSLRVLKELQQSHAIDIIPTFMGAHAFPPEYARDPEAYVRLICEEMIPAVGSQGLARFCDVFCEQGYFSVDQSRTILQAAQRHGLQVRLHADEFTDSGAAELAAELKAFSADHLMAVSDGGIQALAKAGVVATLLPGTTFFLGHTRYAPARKLLDSGVRIALASDFNPGSSHIQSMAFIMTLASIYMGLTSAECLAASTYYSACSLGIELSTGSLEVGKTADIIIWDLEHLEEIPYYVSDVPIREVLKKGQPLSYSLTARKQVQ